MESFVFKAATPQGKVIEGERTVASRAALIDELHAGGFIPIRISPLASAHGLAAMFQLPTQSKRVPLAAAAILLKELATMLGAGISADRAVAIAARTAQSEKLQVALTQTREKLRGGAPFSAALRESVPGLPLSALSLIEAGEASGKLADAFATVSRTIDAQIALRQTLISALIYPAILLATTLGAILFLLTYVIPQFKTVFADAGATLPLPTVILIAVGDGLTHYGIFALFAVFAGVLLLIRWRATPNGRRDFDRFLLRIPFLRSGIAQFEIARISRTLSALLTAKVPLARALGLAGETISNAEIKSAFKAAAARAREGERLGHALAVAGIWPNDAIEFITIGEELGRLDLMLGNLADLYEAGLERRTDRLLSLLTPALTLIMGGMVAAIMGAVISAILGAYDLPS